MEQLTDVGAVVSLLADEPTLSDEQITHLILEASDLVQSEVGREFSDPVPPAVTRIVNRMVARAITSHSGETGVPVGATNMSHSAGPFSESFGFSDGSNDGGVWLTKQERRRLRRLFGGKAFTIRTW